MNDGPEKSPVTFENVEVAKFKPGRRKSYPFEQLEVGGPAMIFNETIDKKREGTIRACASFYGTRNDRKLSVQRLVDGRLAVVRIA